MSVLRTNGPLVLIWFSMMILFLPGTLYIIIVLYLCYFSFELNISFINICLLICFLFHFLPNISIEVKYRNVILLTIVKRVSLMIVSCFGVD